MALTKTRSMERMEAFWMNGETDAIVLVRYKDTWDDPDDADLPIDRPYSTSIRRYNSDGTATDYSGEDTLVAGLCGLLWSDD
jgi:hypothetical protein